jgi:hypothetical protein
MPRFRATAQIIWDFDTNVSKDQAVELARQHLDELPVKDGMSDLRLVLRLDKLKDKVEKVRLGEFSAKDVIPYLSKEETKKEYEINGIKYAVKMNSHRYFLFRESMKCVACGIVATRTFLEHHPADKSPHFNFYGEEDGKLILMTKDHIHAKSCGGEDRHSNYQTMCIICNNLKSHANLGLEAVSALRKLYDENKDQVPKKKLHTMLEDARASFSRPWPQNRRSRPKMTADAISTSCDIAVLRDQNNEMYGQYIYDKIPTQDRYVGCIRKGTYLEPLLSHRGSYMCKLQNEEVILIPQTLVKVNERNQKNEPNQKR